MFALEHGHVCLVLVDQIYKLEVFAQLLGIVSMFVQSCVCGFDVLLLNKTIFQGHCTDYWLLMVDLLVHKKPLVLDKLLDLIVHKRQVIS